VFTGGSAGSNARLWSVDGLNRMLFRARSSADVCDFFAEIDFRHGSRFRRQSPNCWYGVGTTVGTIEGVPHATGSRLNDAKETT